MCNFLRRDFDSKTLAFAVRYHQLSTRESPATSQGFDNTGAEARRRKRCLSYYRYLMQTIKYFNFRLSSFSRSIPSHPLHVQ
ncbi:hypothetical protein LMG28140_02335 [Paraburkholderia metrosideri]|jgi:hypothetical protein|uniref:Uncharacterized protein n=1 Tax=Paraburkholderia metrosideri TaxID=580937 RepID=A0ABM8NKI6_9BURK|nr:hypothetical protein LMG28140_02335 [Paraburkholderia metrosideri]